LGVASERDGRYLRINAFRSSNVDPRGVTVLLPEGYDAAAEAGTRFPVMYFHDGQNLFDPTQAGFGVAWEVDDTLDRLTAAGDVPAMIVVGVHNTAQRIPDYTSSVDPGRGDGGNAMNYGHFLVDELKPWIDATLNTRCGAEHNGLGGSSLGGLVSLYVAQGWPDVYGHVLAMSPSLWWNNNEAQAWAGDLASSAAGSAGGRLWVDAGDLEGDDEAGLGVRSVIRDARQLTEAVRAAGSPQGVVGYLEGFGDEHNEAAWSRRLPAALIHLWGPAVPAEAPGHLWIRVFGDVGVDATRWFSVNAEWGERKLTLANAAAQTTIDPAARAQITPGRITGRTAGEATLTSTWQGAEASYPLTVAGPSTVRFEVTVPANTPEAGPVVVVGSLPVLSTWNPPEGFQLSRQPNGTWTGEIVVNEGQAFEYKLTRGSWDTVEKDANNNELQNRAAVASPDMVLRITVARWFDLP
jgi:enterochelin esterase-like enzyme